MTATGREWIPNEYWENFELVKQILSWTVFNNTVVGIMEALLTYTDYQGMERGYDNQYRDQRICLSLPKKQ